MCNTYMCSVKKIIVTLYALMQAKRGSINPPYAHVALTEDNPLPLSERDPLS